MTGNVSSGEKMGRLDIFDRMRGVQENTPGLKSSKDINIEPVKNRLNGTIITDGPDSILKVDYSYPLVYTHGDVALKDVVSIDPGLLRVLLPALPRSLDLSLNDLIFFDLETTGLSGGAGTYVFMAGFLKVEDEKIKTAQYFLNNLSSEKLFLMEIRDRLKPGSVLVSYNGKSFDCNILKNRFILNGLGLADRDPTHLDLLYTSRRIWKGLFPDFSLRTVEKWALKFERTGDIPGYMIPDIYFQYLRGRDVTEDLCGVFMHNRNDIVSLAAVLLKQLSIVRYCARFDRLNGINNPGQFNPVSLSDMLINCNYHEEAKKLLKSYTDDTEVLKRLGLLYKRQKLHRDALVFFKLLIEKTEDFSEYIFACIEMAKLYEHRLKDIDRAIFYTEKVWNRVRRQDYFYPDRASVFLNDRAHIEKRLDRLRKKQA
ncbi:MAG TPA: hypothetical protein ENI15_15775 [Spirochaetes bacterium]|nr:hypothetical protein [Spirochaetota bacterium]